MKLYLIIIQVIYSFTLPIWFFIWGISFMAFDAGISLGGIVYVLITTLYPIAIIISSIYSWSFQRKAKLRPAFLLSLIPMLWIVSFIGVIFFL